MKVSAVFMLGLVLLPQIDNSVSQERIKDLTSDTHAMQVKGYGSAKHPTPSFESRKGTDGQRKGKGRGNRNRDKLKLKHWNVTVLQDGQNVTYLTLGNNTLQFMGNWSLHIPCLAPCSVNHPSRCTRRRRFNCTCVPRNDEWGRDVGICAMQNVPLGSDQYGRTTAFMPKT
uniref:Putative secreted protein n=1 Tax=Amblyomma parvum TaxID=251391 RepID=A0A023G0C1_AMBPA